MMKYEKQLYLHAQFKNYKAQHNLQGFWPKYGVTLIIV